jgi:hypothetical protein
MLRTSSWPTVRKVQAPLGVAERTRIEDSAEAELPVVEDDVLEVNVMNGGAERVDHRERIDLRPEEVAWIDVGAEHCADQEFSRPPRCGACNGYQIDLRRKGNGGPWYC